jgi:restriction endonuclease Mrr
MSIAKTIKALLAKAASTEFAGEAEAFLAKAHELMEKYQLTHNDLESDDPIGEDRVYERNNPDGVDWDFMLMFGVARYYGCKAIQISRSEKPYYVMGLVGRESARITATEMHLYLVKEVRRLGREAAKNEQFKKMKYDKHFDRHYWAGEYLNADQSARRIGHALNQRLKTLAAESQNAVVPSTAAGKNALITLDRVLTVFKELHPDSATIKGHGGKTTANARQVAEGISLNLQTPGGNGGTKLLG